MSLPLLWPQSGFYVTLLCFHQPVNAARVRLAWESLHPGEAKASFEEGVAEPDRFDDVSAFCHMRPLTSTLYQCFSRYLGSCQSFASPLPSELASCPNQLTRYGCCGGSPFRCLGLFPSINVAGVPLEIETSQHGLLLVDTGMQPFFQLLSLANMRFTFESLLLEKNMLV
eukprot:m.214890 g.214890  ORF g.214890 m.214890 type:complete len:170 (+) comp17196_c0_seq58:536-1045(+)